MSKTVSEDELKIWLHIDWIIKTEKQKTRGIRHRREEMRRQKQRNPPQNRDSHNKFNGLHKKRNEEM